MEAIILCGIQASGKITFYKARFADSHLRLNLDMLAVKVSCSWGQHWMSVTPSGQRPRRVGPEGTKEL